MRLKMECSIKIKEVGNVYAISIKELKYLMDFKNSIGNVYKKITCLGNK